MPMSLLLAHMVTCSLVRQNSSHHYDISHFACQVVLFMFPLILIRQYHLLRQRNLFFLSSINCETGKSCLERSLCKASKYIKKLYFCHSSIPFVKELQRLNYLKDCLVPMTFSLGCVRRPHPPVCIWRTRFLFMKFSFQNRWQLVKGDKSTYSQNISNEQILWNTPLNTSAYLVEFGVELDPI